MSADRFQFLEFAEEEDGPPERVPAELDDAPIPIPRDLNAQILADGTTLAQVRVVDPRHLEAEDDEEEGITLSSLAGQTTQTGPGAAAPTERLRVVEVLGERGTNAGQFQYPTGLAVDRAGVLFVADSFSHRIQRITPDGGVSAIGERGGARKQFLSPQGVATDEQRSFYVVEQGNARVQKFTHDGILTLVFGRPGRGEGELQGPTAIAVAPGTGDIYLADAGNSRVQRFSAEGYFLNVIGAPGPYGAGLSSPQALAAQPGGNLYVADTFAQRLVRFDPLGRPDRVYGESSYGGPRGRGRKKEDGPPLTFYQPRALAVDPGGLLYVADGGEPDPLTGETRGRVRCLSLADGRVLATVERVGRSLGSLLRPGGLAVAPAADGSPRGDLYVADTMNHRILRFVWS